MKKSKPQKSSELSPVQENTVFPWRNRIVSSGESPANSFLAHEYNWRIHSAIQENALNAVLNRIGWVQNVIVSNRTGKILDGHLRVKTALERGEDTPVPFIKVDVTEEEEKEILASIDPIAAMAGTDDEKLRELLGNVEIQIGDQSKELSALLDKIKKDENIQTPGKYDEEKLDEIPEVSEKDAVVQSGDIWELGKHRVMCGDSTKAEDVEKLMGGIRADMVLTDPPYGVDYSAKNEFLNAIDKGNRIQTPIENDNIKDYRVWFASWIRIIPLADYNTVYIFMLGLHLHNLRLAVEDCGIKWGDYLIWVKNNHVLGRKDYSNKTEYVFFGWNNHHKFFGGFTTNVLEFAKPCKNELHPTQKPVPLLEKLLSDGSQREALIYDSFLGSGSTLIACENTSRICYGMEISPHYCDIIIKRWEDLTGKKAEKVVS